jgi:hypothetical protein
MENPVELLNEAAFQAMSYFRKWKGNDDYTEEERLARAEAVLMLVLRVTDLQRLHRPYYQSL